MDFLKRLSRVIAVCALGTLLVTPSFGGGEQSSGPWPVITLLVASGTNPTLINDSDESGVVKLIKSGSSTYTALNFSGRASLSIVQQGSGDPQIEIASPAGHPVIAVTWHHTGGGTSTESVWGGGQATCTDCTQIDAAF